MPSRGGGGVGDGAIGTVKKDADNSKEEYEHITENRMARVEKAKDEVYSKVNQIAEV